MSECKHEVWTFPTQPVSICEECERTSAELKYEKHIEALDSTESVLVVALETQNSKLAKLEAAMVVIEQWAVDKGRFISVEAFRERMQHGVVLAEEEL